MPFIMWKRVVKESINIAVPDTFVAITKKVLKFHVGLRDIYSLYFPISLSSYLFRACSESFYRKIHTLGISFTLEEIVIFVKV